MTIKFTLPFGNKESIKNLVFSILTKEYPLKIIELTNLIKKRYGKSVTFQAVRKALIQLTSDGVLVQNNHAFAINKEWVLESKKVLDGLYQDLTRAKITPKSIGSIKGEVSVFIFSSPNEMMGFWQDIVDDWFKNFKKGDNNVNCYQASHLWEGLLHLDREKKTWEQIKRKKIVSHVLTTGNNPLDRSIKRFYQSIGVEVHVRPASSSFDKSYYVATYGDTIIQFQYPKEIVDKLERFFKTNNTLDELNIKELSDIVNKKVKIKFTVIKNAAMAKQINKSILSQIG